MSNNGQSIQAFNKKAEGGIISAAMPMALMVSGVALSGLAVFTAITPAPVAAIAKIAGILNRVGLDKGPLFLFGATIGALGFALIRLEKANGSSPGKRDSMGFGEQIVDDLEGQSAIMGALQGELGAARTEIAELRRETQEARKSSEGNAATDPMFRLAASLDQLGAQVGKHLDAVARNVQSSIKAVHGSVRESDRHVAELAAKVDAGPADQQAAAELQKLRDQIAGLTGSVEALAGQVEAIQSPAPRHADSGPDFVSAPSEEGHSDAAQPNIQLPRELADSIESAGDQDEPWEGIQEEPHSELSLGPEPAAPVPSGQDTLSKGSNPDEQINHVGTPMDLTLGPIMGPDSEPEGSSEEEHAPLQLGDTQGSSGDSDDPNQPSLFGSELTSVMPIDSESPNPPAPIPQPSEGLELLDDMDDDTARIADLTPPLFPGLGDGAN